MITKSNATQKITKKGLYTQSEINEIEIAMARYGFKNWSDFSIYLVRNSNNIGAISQRQKELLRYTHSNLFTSYNQIVSGINVKDNLKLFVEEARKLCAELM